MAGKPVPKPSILDAFEHLGAFNGKKRWRDPASGSMFTWDALHGHVEAFDHRGFHLGALDPLSGDLVKRAVKGRRIDG